MPKNELYIERRDEGDYAIRQPGSERAATFAARSQKRQGCEGREVGCTEGVGQIGKIAPKCDQKNWLRNQVIIGISKVILLQHR
jgi:hypothetical protein